MPTPSGRLKSDNRRIYPVSVKFAVPEKAAVDDAARTAGEAVNKWIVARSLEACASPADRYTPRPVTARMWPLVREGWLATVYRPDGTAEEREFIRRRVAVAWVREELGVGQVEWTETGDGRAVETWSSPLAAPTAVRFTQEELTRVEKAAARVGVKPGEWIRSVAAAAARPQ